MDDEEGCRKFRPRKRKERREDKRGGGDESIHDQVKNHIMLGRRRAGNIVGKALRFKKKNQVTFIIFFF